MHVTDHLLMYSHLCNYKPPDTAVKINTNHMGIMGPRAYIGASCHVWSVPWCWCADGNATDICIHCKPANFLLIIVDLSWYSIKHQWFLFIHCIIHIVISHQSRAFGGEGWQGPVDCYMCVCVCVCVLQCLGPWICPDPTPWPAVASVAWPPSSSVSRTPASSTTCLSKYCSASTPVSDTEAGGVCARAWTLFCCHMDIYERKKYCFEVSWAFGHCKS